MRKHWIFDWSGTLVDDMGLVIDATNEVLRQYGKEELDREGFRREFTLPYENFYKACLPGVDMDEIEAHFRRAFDASEVGVTPLPYAYEFLAFLKAHGCKLYVLTSMCAHAFPVQAEEVGFADFFTATYAGVLDKREKIGEIMQEHGMGREDTVFVGDMTHDVDTAHHAGIMSVGVLTGYNHAPVLAASEPSIMVQDLDVLRKSISGFAGHGLMKPELVKIRGLEIPTFIGVPDEERSAQQVLKVNIDMQPCKQFEAMGDEIEGGVDYYQVSLRVKELAMSKPRKLVETLVEEIAQLVLDEFQVESVGVELFKFILDDAESVGVCCHRQQNRGC